MDDLLRRFEEDSESGLDPSGGLGHAVAVFEALEKLELSRRGRPPTPAAVDDSGHAPDDQPLRRSPAIEQVLERILDEVVPDWSPTSVDEVEQRHRSRFTESIRLLVEGLDPSFDTHGEHAVPRAARRGVRVLIRNMLGSLDIGRERRAVSTLVAAGMAVPTMCVLNQLLREDLDGHIAPRNASFLTQLALLYLGYLGENPLAGVVVLRWLEPRWLEWREELRRTPLFEPATPEAQDWPKGDSLVEYMASRHKLELLHTAVWALGDVRWDALADEVARAWLREKWKQGVIMLHDVATYGLTDSATFEEHLEAGVPSALSALREAAYYALGVTRWDESQPGESPAQHETIRVAGGLRRRYSHEDGTPVLHAFPIPDDAQSPAEIGQVAVDVLDRVTINGARPPVLDGLRTWRASYRKLVYPQRNQ
jgi:hypothetical protein